MSNANEKIPEIKILYEDADCAVLDKPPGLMVHSDGRNRGPFLADWILAKYPEAKDVGDPMTDAEGKEVNRAGIVHRLDRETSGAIIIAKTAAGHASLKKQFQDRLVKKTYLAFVWGEMFEQFGTINRPIGRSGNDFRKWSATRGMRGDIREAETYWSLVASADLTEEKTTNIPANLGRSFSLIQAEPKTGRTHQIRVHLNALNRPVVGDILYAPKRPFALGFSRLALHSWTIEFLSLPAQAGLNGKPVKIEAPLPADFIFACKELNIPTPKVIHHSS